MKIITVVGARPQFVKAAALSREIRKHNSLNELIIHTGQHFDSNMSDIFFEEMEIPKPDFQLNINGLSHGAMTGQMLESIEKILIEEKPDLVLVYGDTNSTLAGALAASKLHIKIAHVEAGLRSFNMQMPEEINRILTDRISNLLFCPTQTAINNLEKEGFGSFDSKISLTGDVMQDAALYYAEKAEMKSSIIESLQIPQPFALVTFHRQENTSSDENLSAIVNALNTINKHIKVIAPIHPGTMKKMSSFGLIPEFECIEPVGYFDMLMLLKKCSIVITDSGGLQKEAFFFGKFCVTMREQTEWTELVQHGYNLLAGSNKDLILSHTLSSLNKSFPESKNLYGNGHACENITNILLQN